MGKDHISCIIEPKDFDSGGLYLGDIFAASRPSTLRADLIKAVLTVATDTNLKYTKDIKHLKIPADDRPEFDLKSHFKQGISFIEKHIKNTNVFVHCMAGVSRSGAMVVAYIMKTRN